MKLYSGSIIIQIIRIQCKNSKGAFFFNGVLKNNIFVYNTKGYVTSPTSVAGVLELELHAAAFRSLSRRIAARDVSRVEPPPVYMGDELTPLR